MTYITATVEFNTIVALVVLMERCIFVSEGAETNRLYRSYGTFHFIENISRGSALILIKRELCSAVKKLDCQTYNWRFLLQDIAFGGGVQMF